MSVADSIIAIEPVPCLPSCVPYVQSWVPRTSGQLCGAFFAVFFMAIMQQIFTVSLVVVACNTLTHMFGFHSLVPSLILLAKVPWLKLAWPPPPALPCPALQAAINPSGSQVIPRCLRLVSWCPFQLPAPFPCLFAFLLPLLSGAAAFLPSNVVPPCRSTAFPHIVLARRLCGMEHQTLAWDTIPLQTVLRSLEGRWQRLADDLEAGKKRADQFPWLEVRLKGGWGSGGRKAVTGTWTWGRGT